MAQSRILTLEAVDVRRATVPGLSRANIITKMVVPAIKFVRASRNPGGGVMEVNHVMPRVEAPEPKFDVKGFDEDIFTNMGTPDKWTFAGAVRQRGRSRMLPMRVVVEGAVAEWEMDETDPNEFSGCSHTFDEVTHYSLHIDGVERWYIDANENEIRRNGVSLTVSVNEALGI